jgi:hypothetical protein
MKKEQSSTNLCPSKSAYIYTYRKYDKSGKVIDEIDVKAPYAYYKQKKFNDGTTGCFSPIYCQDTSVPDRFHYVPITKTQKYSDPDKCDSTLYKNTSSCLLPANACVLRSATSKTDNTKNYSAVACPMVPKGWELGANGSGGSDKVQNNQGGGIIRMKDGTYTCQIIPSSSQKR